MGRSRRWALVAVCGGLAAGCELSPSSVSECQQSAARSPLPTALVEFLPPLDRGDAPAAADTLLADGVVTLASQPPYLLPADPTWRENPYGEPSWVHEYQSLLFVLDALVAYMETEHDQYLDIAQLVIERWLADYLHDQWSLNWNEHVIANRARVLLLAWELMRARDPSSPVVGDVCHALQRHAERLMTPAVYRVNHNHGYFQDEALLALAASFEDHPERGVWLDTARVRIVDQIDYAVTDEGVHREHSPSYHVGMQMRFARFARLLDQLGIALPYDIDRVVARMSEFVAHFALPSRRAPLVGDSSPWPGDPSFPWLSEAARYSLSQGRAGAASTQIDRVFFRSGYAFFRDAWHPSETFTQTVYVGFVAGLFSRVHKHCDDLSVMVHGYGHSWLADIGFWSYDLQDPYALFSRSCAAHNIVAVDDANYDDDYPDVWSESVDSQLLTDFDIRDEAAMVEGQHQLNDGVTFRRKLTYTRPADVVIDDTLVADDRRSHDYVLYWHIGPDKSVVTTGAGSYAVTTPDPLGPTMELRVTGAPSPQCHVVIGATEPVQGWFFPRFRQRLPAPVIACAQRAVDASFRTAIHLAPAQTR